MHRIYDQFIKAHFKENRQMLFMTGPSQVGKTTLAQAVQKDWKNIYHFSWTNKDQKENIRQGPEHIAKLTKLTNQQQEKPLIIFDEIHKYGQWKLFLKGFYDTYPNLADILVTGSARLDVYQKGGDSLMGRYFLCHAHPFSIAEIADQNIIDTEIRTNLKQIDAKAFETLWQFGGFPEPFLRADKRFYTRWENLKTKQRFKKDVRDITQIQEIEQFATLAEILKTQVGQPISYTALAKKVRVSDKTIRAWIKALKSLYFLFEVKPFTKNIANTLLKEPKYYLWDWAGCKDPIKRTENFIASHLLKAIHFWEDYGFGEYRLHYLKDKTKRAVDFLITKNENPWILVKVQTSNNQGVSPALEYFQKATQAPFAFQVDMNMPFVNKNCFDYHHPMIVPATTFLSQLV